MSEEEPAQEIRLQRWDLEWKSRCGPLEEELTVIQVEILTLSFALICST